MISRKQIDEKLMSWLTKDKWSDCPEKKPYKRIFISYSFILAIHLYQGFSLFSDVSFSFSFSLFLAVLYYSSISIWVFILFYQYRSWLETRKVGKQNK